MELSGLNTKTLGRTLIHLPEVGSTNDYVKAHADHLDNLAVIIADAQTAGKGRLGRSWASLKGEGLYFSVFLRELPLSLLTSLPLVVALAVHRALTGLCDLPFGIKWSNDILFQERKLCGILCEIKTFSGVSSGVIGIGVNLAQTRERLESLGLVYATSLFLATDKLFSQENVACSICNELEPALDSFFFNGFEPMIDDYRARCVTLGSTVTIARNGSETRAVALDIASDGCLVCNIDGKVTAVAAGEVLSGR